MLVGMDTDSSTQWLAQYLSFSPSLSLSLSLYHCRNVQVTVSGLLELLVQWDPPDCLESEYLGFEIGMSLNHRKYDDQGNEYEIPVDHIITNIPLSQGQNSLVLAFISNSLSLSLSLSLSVSLSVSLLSVYHIYLPCNIGSFMTKIHIICHVLYDMHIIHRYLTARPHFRTTQSVPSQSSSGLGLKPVMLPKSRYYAICVRVCVPRGILECMYGMHAGV